MNAAQQTPSLPPLPLVGPIGHARAADVEMYRPKMEIGPRLPGVRDVALWTTDQMQAYALAAIASAIDQRDAQRSNLQTLAAIAHAGGLVGMSEHEALVAIRRLSLPHWDTSATPDQQRAAIAKVWGAA